MPRSAGPARARGRPVVAATGGGGGHGAAIVRPCSAAQREAAAREETPSLLSMDRRCWSTVRGARYRRAVAWALVRPEATRRSTSTSRAESPAGSVAPVLGEAEGAASIAASASARVSAGRASSGSRRTRLAQCSPRCRGRRWRPAVRPAPGTGRGGLIHEYDRAAAAPVRKTGWGVHTLHALASSKSPATGARTGDHPSETCYDAPLPHCGMTWKGARA